MEAASPSRAYEPDRIPQHHGVKKFLRLGGPVLLAVGGLFTLVGLGSFFLAMATHDGPPALFFCAFIGLPLLFFGGVMCLFGYLGAFARYVAAEQAPVAKDTINYLAGNTQDAVRTVARAAAQGVTEGVQRAQPPGDGNP